MPRPTLVIGNKNYSSWSMRPWLALRAAEIVFDEIRIALQTPHTTAEIVHFSPAGKVPVLVEGDLVTWESLAICERAAELAPAAGLWPADAAARTVARAVSAEMHAGFTALRGLLPCNLRIRVTRALTPEAAADVARIVSLWRECRERFGSGGEFLFGRFGIADAMFAPVVTRLRSYGVAVDDRTARRYCDAVLDWPNFREWETDALAETERIALYEP